MMSVKRVTSEQVSIITDEGIYLRRESRATRETNKEDQFMKSGETFLNKWPLSRDSELRRASHMENQADGSQSHVFASQTRRVCHTQDDDRSVELEYAGQSSLLL